ncbi:uncharacterized protein CELE_H12D21.5 [Caenorhabditis elegans]|uniref:Uncharacterized protein n=1 Tax=Caenorhabditis elegans TaxID=6239 RepID=Q9XTW7_CAEEL|nr:Uncharacterized protein CELE_H12D21.5 [Caenorhabditis elegans]CAB07431.3 Uncharacterized protein CELE_H12D21.5 [Caenorhabditis elegans]|eukprot:NP_506672.3 Uncharacterized protein CELE_H12D21.5 [Caenorhabditis elegans]
MQIRVIFLIGFLASNCHGFSDISDENIDYYSTSDKGDYRVYRSANDNETSSSGPCTDTVIYKPVEWPWYMIAAIAGLSILNVLLIIEIIRIGRKWLKLRKEYVPLKGTKKGLKNQKKGKKSKNSNNTKSTDNTGDNAQPDEQKQQKLESKENVPDQLMSK